MVGGDVKSLKKGDHIHFMGVCGTAMASLAVLLKERGFKISGSDQNVYPPMSVFLAQKGIQIAQGYGEENLTPRPDFVVVGNVISKANPEAQALLKSTIDYGTLPQVMGDLVIGDHHCVAVCGTHGKTTTTSLAAWVFNQSGVGPGFFVGGLVKNFQTSFKEPQGDFFIIEGDEYDTAFFAKVPKFLFYKPRSVILTSIEFDHGDIYKNLDSVVESFAQLLKIIPPEGLLIYNAQDARIQKILHLYKGDQISYGLDEGVWQARNIQSQSWGINFDVYYRGKKEKKFFFPMPGHYNALNVLSVYILSKAHGLSLSFQGALDGFQGVSRRQELIGRPRGIQVIEDFAHHPTAVKGTLESLKNQKGRLFALFEPASNTSCRSLFQSQYVEALSLGDFIFICKPGVKSLRWPPQERLQVDVMVGELESLGKKAFGFEKVEEILPLLTREACSGDRIVIMSNGGFQGVYQKILRDLAET